MRLCDLLGKVTFGAPLAVCYRGEERAPFYNKRWPFYVVPESQFTPAQLAETVCNIELFEGSTLLIVLKQK